MLKKSTRDIKAKLENSAKSFTKSISSISTPTNTTKMAITGLSRSGKTVFITSLIDQLIHQKK